MQLADDGVVIKRMTFITRQKRQRCAEALLQYFNLKSFSSGSGIIDSEVNRRVNPFASTLDMCPSTSLANSQPFTGKDRQSLPDSNFRQSILIGQLLNGRQAMAHRPLAPYDLLSQHARKLQISRGPSADKPPYRSVGRP